MQRFIFIRLLQVLKQILEKRLIKILHFKLKGCWNVLELEILPVISLFSLFLQKIHFYFSFLDWCPSF